MEDKANVQADGFDDSDATAMQIAATDVLFNNGTFTVETTGSVSTVAVPEDGWYDISGHIFFNGSSGRSNPRMRIGRTRGATTIYGIATTGGYLRGSGTFSADSTGVFISQLWQLESGDKIFFQFLNSGNLALDLDGDQSWLQIVKREGKLTVTGGGFAEGEIGILDLGPHEHLPTPDADSAEVVRKQGNPTLIWTKNIERHNSAAGDATETVIVPGATGYEDFKGVLNRAPAIAELDRRRLLLRQPLGASALLGVRFRWPRADRLKPMGRRGDR